jgi:dienelactone hydrolase
MIKLFLLGWFLFCTQIVIACSKSSRDFLDIASAETIVMELTDRKFGKSEVPIEFVMPTQPRQKPVPLVILQHGSTQDAKNIFNGSVNTDVHQYQLAKEALKNGFAVAIVDAFYKKDLKPGDKSKFPQAHVYAQQIAKYFSQNSELDKNNFFYSGFSYGAHSVTMLMNNLYFSGSYKWAGLVSAEPPCGRFHEPRAFIAPLLTIKGGESHYKTKPCQIMTDLYKQAGSQAEIFILPKSNHYFSHNGKFVKGLAVNGCADNPVIIKQSGGAMFLDGTKATKKIIKKKCYTKQAGSGKSREDLEQAITISVEFFIKNLN